MVKDATKSEKIISEKHLISLLRGINQAKDKQAQIGGDIREQVKYAVDNDNYHPKAGAHVAKIIRMNDKDPLALAEFDRKVELYREMAVRSGLLQEHVGDLLEGSEPNEIEADEAEQFDASARYDEIIAAEKDMAAKHAAEAIGVENGKKVARGIKALPANKRTEDLKRAAKKVQKEPMPSTAAGEPWDGFKN